MTERAILQLAVVVALAGGLGVYLHVTRRHALMLLWVVAATAAAVYVLTSLVPILPTAGRPGLIRFGLDLRGGTRLVLQAYDTPEVQVTEAGLDAALEVMRRRVDALGVAEPSIYRVSGQPRIIVELAGVTEEEARDIVRIANLEFRRHDGTVVVTGKDLQNAQAQLGPGGEPQVLLTFTPEGRKKFAEATTEVYNTPGCGGLGFAPECQIQIYLDDTLVQSPRVASPGIENAEISPYASLEEANRIASILKVGALPLNMRIEEVREISASLGQESVERSRTAVLIGSAAVVAFMLLYYRVMGLVADFALLVYLMLVLVTLAGVNAVLTLPGIAGLLLSVGMAVDANVIIFERIKEELRGGRTLRAAIDAGFRRAWTAILDGNVTTLVGTAVLFYFGTGPIRGFAVTLSVGVLASMFTAIVFTRYVLRLLTGARLTTDPRLLIGIRMPAAAVAGPAGAGPAAGAAPAPSGTAGAAPGARPGARGSRPGRVRGKGAGHARPRI